MRLLVATNCDPELIEPLSELEAMDQIFGVLPSTMVGSGRPGNTLPKVDVKASRRIYKIGIL